MAKALISVKGGLGNQLFFYAFSLYLQNIGYHTRFVWFHYIFTKHHHGIELYSCFSIDNTKQSHKGVFFVRLGQLLHYSLLKRGFGLIFKLFYVFFYKRIQQVNPYSFTPTPPSFLPGALYFDGFWQNYQYIMPIENKLREKLHFLLPKTGVNTYYTQYIKSTNSVSIHIRRGDYLSKDYNDLYVIHTVDYYNRAIKIINNSCTNPTFFIFTDDMTWTKENLQGENIVYVEGNQGDKSYLDMYFMSLCKHNIISNSTFSWWGAWLNSNPQKIVIAPSQWTTNYPSTLICPKDWILIEP